LPDSRLVTLLWTFRQDNNVESSQKKEQDNGVWEAQASFSFGTPDLMLLKMGPF
jgi:hypothetical protein